MPSTPEAYAYTPVNYVGESGSIPALLLYERGGLSYVRFWTQSWLHYDGWSGWVTTALHSEHVVAADPHEPAVVDLFRELEREAAAQLQHLSNRRHQANGQHAKERVEQRVRHPEKPTEKLTATQGNGVKPPPKSAPARGRRARANAEDAHSLKPVRSIAGLTIADFLYDR